MLSKSAHDDLRRDQLLYEAGEWRRIAARIGNGQWNRHGLCREIEESRWPRWPSSDAGPRISRALYHRMNDRINDHMGTMRADNPGGMAGFDGLPGSAYFAPTGDAGPRVIAALLLAEECEDEASAL